MYGVPGARRGEIKHLPLLCCIIIAIMYEEYMNYCYVLLHCLLLRLLTILFCSQLHIELCQFKHLGTKIPFLLFAWDFLGKITKIFQLFARYFEAKPNILSKLMHVNILLVEKFMGNKDVKWIFLFLFMNLKSQTCLSDELLKSCSLHILSWDFQ